MHRGSPSEQCLKDVVQGSDDGHVPLFPERPFEAIEIDRSVDGRVCSSGEATRDRAISPIVQNDLPQATPGLPLSDIESETSILLSFRRLDVVLQAVTVMIQFACWPAPEETLARERIFLHPLFCALPRPSGFAS